MQMFAVNNQLIMAPTAEEAVDVYYASRREDLERQYLEQFEWNP